MARMTGMAALMISVATGPAFAEVTPQQVWDDLKTYMEGFGYSVEGSESSAGGVLTVSDLVMGFDLPEEDTAFSITMESMAFADQGDGTVMVTFPPSMPIALAFVDPDEDGPVNMVLDYTQEGLEVIVSGEPDALVYDYTADRLGMSLSGLVVDGEPVTRDIARVDVTMGPMTGRSTVTRSDTMQSIAQEMTLGDVTYDFAFNDPDGDDSGLFSGSYAAVTLQGTSNVPMGFDMTDMDAVVAAGLEGTAVMAHQGGALEFAVNEGDGPTTGQSSSTAGTLDVAFTGDALRYALASTDATLALSGPEIPFPVNFALAESGLSLTVPLTPSDAPRDAELALTLGGFTMSELLWNIFDPGANLPRDPATIAFDLAARVTPFVSLFDAEAMAEIEETGAAPGELNALSLRDLLIEAAGGRITGTGDFVFDNTDLDSFDGLPRPEGALNLTVSGANGLIDKLIAMGLMQDSDAMGARMMLSMFTVPGDAPDTATSKIEINAAGHILANGQRIQ